MDFGYTEHSYRHLGIVSERAGNILRDLGFDERTVELTRIAGYMHDIGNCVNRVDHAHSGAILSYNILKDMGMNVGERTEIMMAIGNHDENTGTAISNISAALILADKSDVARSRVSKTNIATFDIEKQVVNLKDDGSGKNHFVQVGITLELDSSAEDYADLNTVLTNSTGAVFDECRDVIQGYTMAEVSEQKTQESIKKQILERLQKKYGTHCIYSVSFSSFTTQ